MSINNKIKAREQLLLSAYIAKQSGISREVWEASQEVRSFVSNVGLMDDIIKHVSAWVWTSQFI